MAVKFADAYGCDVTAFTSSESKFDEARGFGAKHVVSSRDSAAVKKLARTMDLLIVTANAPLDWDAMIGTLAPNGRMHVVGTIPEPIPVAVFPLILGQSQHLRLADRLACGHRDDAGVRGPTRRLTPDRALPDEPNQRSLSASPSGQSALSDRA